jgi:hypothetical protein
MAGIDMGVHRSDRRGRIALAASAAGRPQGAGSRALRQRGDGTPRNRRQAKQ